MHYGEFRNNAPMEKSGLGFGSKVVLHHQRLSPLAVMVQHRRLGVQQVFIPNLKSITRRRLPEATSCSLEVSSRNRFHSGGIKFAIKAIIIPSWLSTGSVCGCVG